MSVRFEDEDGQSQHTSTVWIPFTITGLSVMPWIHLELAGRLDLECKTPSASKWSRHAYEILGIFALT